ncbi:MAG: tetratricopeptide repeat protein [Sphingomonadaceae bacterium]|nr:tetratricopeptide repeat protein [Sphingomonadaceae bacterium]
MKLFHTTALGLALALGATAMVATQPVAAKSSGSSKPAHYSDAIQKNLPVAQKAIDAGQTDAAKTAIAAAEAGIQTPDDKYAVGGLTLNLGIKSNDTALESKGINLMIDSGQAPADQLPKLLGNQAQLAIQARDYNTAEAAYTKLVQLDPNNGDNVLTLAEIKDQNKKPAEALQLIQQAVAAKKAAGQQVPQDIYKRGFAIAYNAKNAAAVASLSSALVQAYPSPDNWRDTLQVYRELNNPDVQANLDLYRLQRAAKALKGERDFYEYTNSALDRGLPGEAAAVIDEGTAANMIGGPSKALTEVKSLSSAKVAADKASLASSATRASSASNGKVALNTADAYLGYGDYAKAAELYKLALQKGGVDADTVNTRLGIALARSGQKAAALQAFGAVNGPVRKGIAQYWIIWTNQQA